MIIHKNHKLILNEKDYSYLVNHKAYICEVCKQIFWQQISCKNDFLCLKSDDGVFFLFTGERNREFLSCNEFLIKKLLE
jgi:transcription initiation factor IIE alpha subunit